MERGRSARSRFPEARETLIERARNAGCEALVVTVDAQIYGNREWHKRTTAGSEIIELEPAARHIDAPRWLARGIATHGMPRFENVVEFVPKNRRGSFDSAHWDPFANGSGALLGHAVEDPRALAAQADHQGLLSGEDVVHAAEIGADGGVRRGTDVIKAVALGADAVLAGRAVLYGVAAAGREGAKRALTILREELERDLGLLGVPSIDGLSPRLLVRTGGLGG